jgi:multidrug resistance protein, MATE family
VSVLHTVGPGAQKNILIALGEVKIPAVITMVAFYLIGIPLSIYITFGPPHWMDISGIWVGLLVGVVFMVSGFGVVLSRLDFEVVATKARARALEVSLDT